MTQRILTLTTTYGSCRPVLSKLILRTYVAIPVPTPDDMTEEMISVCLLHNNVSGLVMLFHVSYALSLVFETTLY